MAQVQLPTELLPGNGIIIFSAAMTLFTGLAVLLRFYFRAQSTTPFAADDWWILTALTFFYVSMAVEIWLVIESHKLKGNQDPASLARIFKVIYALSVTPCSTTAAAKISFLCLYHRLFPVKAFQRKCLIVAGLVAIQWVIWVSGFYLQCMPIRGIWDITVPKTCINIPALFLVLEIYSCVCDVVMIWLPLGMIRGLQIPFKRKVAVASVFLLGALVLVAAIVRVCVIYRPDRNTLPLKPSIITTTAEHALHILCACFPIYGPLLSRIKTSYVRQEERCHIINGAIKRRALRDCSMYSVNDTHSLAEVQGAVVRHSDGSGGEAGEGYGHGLGHHDGYPGEV